MQYKQPRNIKKHFVDFINKVFSLNKEWENVEVEVIELKDDNAPDAFEQYPWDNEEYPRIAVFSNGSDDDHWAIDSRIGDYWTTLYIGDRARDYVVLGRNPIAFGIKSVNDPLVLRSVDIAAMYKGPYEEDITIKLWSTTANGLLPNTLLASGSISGKSLTRMEWMTTSLTPTITLTADTNYFISAEASSGSYYLMLDNDPSVNTTPFIRYATYLNGNWTGIGTKTALARVNGPVYRRLGGGQENSIRVFIEAKDLSTTQKISDLLYVYFHLIKHSNLTRKAKMTYPNTTGMNYDFVSDLTDEGIYIINVNKGAESVRPRGNDRLFSIELSLSCYSNWTEDFELPELKDFDIDVDSY